MAVKDTVKIYFNEFVEEIRRIQKDKGKACLEAYIRGLEDGLAYKEKRIIEGEFHSFYERGHNNGISFGPLERDNAKTLFDNYLEKLRKRVI